MYSLIQTILTIGDLISISMLLLMNVGGLISGDTTTLGIVVGGLILIAVNAEIVGAILGAIGEIISSIFRF